MKKTLLILSLMVAPVVYADDAIRADDFLNNVMETSPILLDEEIGAKVFDLIQDKVVLEEISRMIKLNFSSEKILRLKELLMVMVEFEFITKDPEFEKQWAIFIKASQRLNNPNIIESEIKAEIVTLEKECPLIVQQNVLYEKLKGFYSGLAKGMQDVKMNEVLELVMGNLD
jgi:hypothetical protein